ncbi:MAG: alpha/beta hydrolase [bacterium]|nr:alpha/beta hydrolase [bacterium]
MSRAEAVQMYGVVLVHVLSDSADRVAHIAEASALEGLLVHVYDWRSYARGGYVAANRVNSYTIGGSVD